MPILLTSDLDAHVHDQSREDFRIIQAGARQAGWKVLTLPNSKAALTEALAGLSSTAGPILFSGYHLAPDQHRQLAAATEETGHQLLMTPKESMSAMYFDRWYPLLDRYTAESVIIDGVVQDDPRGPVSVGEKLGYPVFVKGMIKSRKESGMIACRADDQADLERVIMEYSKERPGSLAIRKLLPLRSQGMDHNGFPISREYRLFIHDGRLLGSGFYWAGEDPFGRLTADEQDTVIGLARLAGERIRCPLLAVDVAQLEDGSWKIIEIGDPQFARINQHMLPLAYFSLLATHLS